MLNAVPERSREKAPDDFSRPGLFLVIARD
jgi:hypothetical protein